MLRIFNILNSTKHLSTLFMKNNRSKGSILIVEDDMLLSLVEGRIIEKLGYEVVGKATTGEQAVELVRDLNPDAVVMDISLKGKMSGIDALEEIREFSNIPVIFLSGDSDRESIQEAKKSGNADYLVKPIKADDILLPLKRAVGKSTSSRSTQLS